MVLRVNTDVGSPHVRRSPPTTGLFEFSPSILQAIDYAHQIGSLIVKAWT